MLEEIRDDFTVARRRAFVGISTDGVGSCGRSAAIHDGHGRRG